MLIARWAVLAAAVVTTALVPVTDASPLALDTHVVASEKPGGYGYTVEVVVADVAGTLTFTNADLRAHDVVATAEGPDTNPWCARYAGACPLFATPLIGLAEQAPVEGVHQLVPGDSYGFYCSVHPWMTGTLVAI